MCVRATHACMYACWHACTHVQANLERTARHQTCHGHTHAKPCRHVSMHAMHTHTDTSAQSMHAWICTKHARMDMRMHVPCAQTCMHKALHYQVLYTAHAPKQSKRERPCTRHRADRAWHMTQGKHARMPHCARRKALLRCTHLN